MIICALAQQCFGSKSEENNALFVKDYLLYMLIHEYHVCESNGSSNASCSILDDTFGQIFFHETALRLAII